MTITISNTNRRSTASAETPRAHIEIQPGVVDVRTSGNVHVDVDMYGPGKLPSPPPSSDRMYHTLPYDGPSYRGGSIEHLPRGPEGIHLRKMPTDAEIKAALADARGAYTSWMKEHPGVKQPSDGRYNLGEILDGKDGMTCQDQSLRIILMILNESPAARAELCDEITHRMGGDDSRAGIPDGEIPPGGAAGPEAPAAPAAPAAPPAAPAQQQDPMAQMMGMLGPIAQVAGPIMQVAGGILASPIGTLGLTAIVAAIPGADVLTPFVPAIAFAGGMALTAGGGMVSNFGKQQAAQQAQQAANGGAASPGAAPAAAPAAPGAPAAAAGAQTGAFDPSVLLQIFQVVGPMLGAFAGAMGGAPGATPGIPGAAAAPALPLPVPA